tara:strand:- start:206 stop:688 length:483 start_codon:yes stop_codon:yes gene_type:complete
MTDNNSSNKNIWLAISLAIITSLTSLGTAFISKGGEASGDITTEFKVFEEAIKRDIKELNKKFDSDNRISNSYKIIVSKLNNSCKEKLDVLEKSNKDLIANFNILKKGVYNYINDEIKQAASDSIDRDIYMQKLIDKNTNNSLSHLKNTNKILKHLKIKP